MRIRTPKPPPAVNPPPSPPRRRILIPYAHSYLVQKAHEALAEAEEAMAELRALTRDHQVAAAREGIDMRNVKHRIDSDLLVQDQRATRASALQRATAYAAVAAVTPTPFDIAAAAAELFGGRREA